MWKLCYRKDDRAMRPIRGRGENFRDSLATPTATIPKLGFCADPPYELVPGTAVVSRRRRR